MTAYEERCFASFLCVRNLVDRLTESHAVCRSSDEERKTITRCVVGRAKKLGLFPNERPPCTTTILISV